MHGTHTKLAIVIPVYGNAESLQEVHRRIIDATKELDVDLTILFVNDRSPDNSQEILEKLVRIDPQVRVILLSKNHGSFVAIAAGLKEMDDHDAVVILSADLQDQPELIPEMVAKWRSGKPVVLCVRRRRSDPIITRICANLYYKIYRALIMPDMPDGGFDYCLIDRRVVRVIVDSSEKSTNLASLILWAGFDRAKIPYDRTERKHGKSMWTLRKKIDHAINGIVSFSSLPLKAFAMLGLVLSVLCVVYGVFVVWQHFIGKIPVPGWTSLTLMILIFAAFQLMAFGVLGEYFWNNMEQTRRRPMFIVDKRLGAGVENLATDKDEKAVPFFDIGAVSSPVAHSLIESAARVLRGSQVILGREVHRFERELAVFIGMNHAIGVANGTDALTLALWAAGVKRGDRVLTTALSSPATAVAIVRAGAIPVLVDIEPDFLTLSPAAAEHAAKQGASAVVPVHLYGNPCDMMALQEIACKYRLAIVEDCAQSLGSTSDNHNCGTFSVASAFSFYPTKNLGGYGDGGAVLTDDPGLMEHLRMMRFYGQNSSGECVLRGLNSRLDELQAALLSERLKIVESQNEERRRIARLYDAELGFLNPVPSRQGRAPHLYVVRPSERDAFRNFLAEQRVLSGVHYPLALTHHVYLRNQGVPTDCPVAEKECLRVVSLPCFPGMTSQQVEHVIDTCKAWASQSSNNRAEILVNRPQ